MSGEKEVLVEIKALLDKLYEQAQEQESHTLLVEILIIQSQLALVDYNMKEVDEFLDHANEIAEENEADIANYGYVSGPKNQRFSDKGMNRMRAIAFNKIGDIKMEELYTKVPNYLLGLKSASTAKLDNGLKTPFFKNTFKALTNYLEKALEYKIQEEMIPAGIQAKILDLIKSLIHTPDQYRDLRFDGYAADVVLPNHLKSGLVRVKDRTFRKTYRFRISDPEQFLRMSSDFWTFTKQSDKSIVDFFDPEYKSAEKIDKALWEKIVTGKKVDMKNWQLRMIKQFNPPHNKIEKRYNLEERLIRATHRSNRGITITEKKAFDGLVKGINPQDFPGGYFGEIIRLNSFMKRNPTPPKTDSEKFRKLITECKELTLISTKKMLKRTPESMYRIKVKEIPGLAYYLTGILQLEMEDIKKIKGENNERGFSLLYLIKRMKADRYSDHNVFGKIKDLRDELIEKGDKQIKDIIFSEIFGPFWWLTVLNP